MMIALVVCLMQFCVVNPIYYKCGVSIDLFPLVFSLLMVSILTIAAAGYVINDYFDTKIDEINKPSKVIVGKTVTRAQAGTYFQTLLVIGNIAGIALAAITRDLTLVFIYAGVSGILWFYSSSYKRQLLLGNIMISICT
ncbi:MAG: UbiA family prenyltransferase, partial [Paludibacteraceae bacterium]|nr:UbiA family prenyltransferase [Paludibacteraceae bacterium]